MTNVIKLISLFLDIIDLIWISLGDGSIYLFRIIPLELSSLVAFFFGAIDLISNVVKGFKGKK